MCGLRPRRRRGRIPAACRKVISSSPNERCIATPRFYSVPIANPRKPISNWSTGEMAAGENAVSRGKEKKAGRSFRPSVMPKPLPGGQARCKGQQNELSGEAAAKRWSVPTRILFGPRQTDGRYLQPGLGTPRGKRKRCLQSQDNSTALAISKTRNTAILRTNSQWWETPCKSPTRGYNPRNSRTKRDFWPKEKSDS